MFKIWVQIEEVDELEDTQENVSEPIDVAFFDTLEKAQIFVATLDAATAACSLSTED